MQKHVVDLHKSVSSIRDEMSEGMMGDEEEGYAARVGHLPTNVMGISGSKVHNQNAGYRLEGDFIGETSLQGAHYAHESGKNGRNYVMSSDKD